MHTPGFAIAASIVVAITLTGPAYSGNGSAVGAGILGFGVGAIVGSAIAPQTVYVAPPPPVYVAPPAPVYVGPVYYGRPYPYYRHHR
jgi:hypothetical protein